VRSTYLLVVHTALAPSTEKSAKIEAGENSLMEQIICGLHLAMAVYHENEAPLLTVFS